MGFSSPCIDTPDGFGQRGAMGGSSGCNGGSANVSSSSSSINLIPKVLFYSQTPLYGHPLNMNTLLYYGQFALSAGKGSPYIFSKFNRHNKNTPLIRTLSVPINGVWLYLSPKVQGRDGLSHTHTHTLQGMIGREPESSGNEWFSSNRILMFCAQDFGIARGQTLQVATKKCMAWSSFSVKSSVFGHRMPHFAVILWETEVTNVGALKFQVSV